MKKILIAFIAVLAVTSCKNTDPAPDHSGAFTIQATGDDFRVPAEIKFVPEDSLENASYLWDFGDGTTTTQVQPGKVFTTPGDKTVRLSVTANGITKTETRTFTVQAPFTRVYLKKATVLSAPTTNGAKGWDTAVIGDVYVTGAPDVYLVMRRSGNNINSYASVVKVNVSSTRLTDGSLFWDASFLLSNSLATESTLIFTLRDADESSTATSSKYDVMGNAYLTLSNLITLENKYPTTIDLPGTSSNLKIRLDLEWK